MKFPRICALLSFLSLSGVCLGANVVNVSLEAANGAKWSEYVSGAYAELGSNWNGNPSLDGPYEIATGNPIAGSNGLTAFPAGSAWNDIGSLTLDGTATGAGVENFSITGAAFDFSAYMADNDAVVGGYASAVTSITSGTIELTNGAITNLNFEANLAFIYDFSAFGVGPTPFAGTLTVDESSFVLAVDQSYPNPGNPGGPPVRYVWDATGTTSALNLVPEPSSALLGSLGMLILYRRRRR
ncbi:MAG: hypothetical protein CMP28_13070 [Roseibacillus sp.]|nr:hypothetical protein [Roseibacillus sp.]